MQDTSTQLPVRGNDAIEILMNDHEVIKALLNDLLEATAVTSRRRALEHLKAALVVHNATEENLVYPALRTIARKKLQAETLYHETAEADVIVFELDTMLKDGDGGAFATKASKLQKAVLAHIEEEESMAFPQLQKKADPEHAEALTEAVRDFREAFRFEPAAS